MSQDDMNNSRKQINIHRSRLVHLLQQRDKLGADTPPYTHMEIQEARTAITALRAGLWERYSLRIPADAVDADVAPWNPPMKVQPDWIHLMLATLNVLETQINEHRYDDALRLINQTRQQLKD